MEGAEGGGASAPGESERSGEPGAGGARDALVSPPTPVRAGMGSAPASAEVPPPAQRPEVTVVVEGVRWQVRAIGRGGSVQAPLLVLGFFHPDEPGVPRWESLVVGRAVEHLTELQLEEAWRAAGPAVPTGARRPFFPEIVARGGQEG